MESIDRESPISMHFLPSSSMESIDKESPISRHFFPSSSMESIYPALPISMHNKFRIFMFPFFAPSHLMAMVDLAHLLGEHPNVEPTIVTTTDNVALIRPSLDSSVKLLTNSLDAGMEDFSTASSDDSLHADDACRRSQVEQESLIRAYKPDAIIADIFNSVASIACELSIPCFTFSPVGVFSQIVINNLFPIRLNIIARKNGDPYECFGCVPNLPGPQIAIPPSELPDLLVKDDFLASIFEEVVRAQVNGAGTIVNTFYDLESDYCENYKKVYPNTYFVGPLALSKNNTHKQRGGKGDMACLEWLDHKDERSVVFVCFGSWYDFTNAQLHELALGLENSGKNFLWVVRGGKDSLEEDWMPKEWEKRVEPRGLIVRGWVPQLLILKHASVGAFMTHCGWNSTLEGITSGTPMLTWPLASEQFINERLIVEVKECGARVWEGGKRSVRDEEKLLVPKDVIAKSVSDFMKPGGIGEKARARALEIAAKANFSVNVHEGSSRTDLNHLISDLLKSRINEV